MKHLLNLAPQVNVDGPQIKMKMSNIEGNTLYTMELIGIKNKSDLIDEPLFEKAIRASDHIIKLPSEP